MVKSTRPTSAGGNEERFTTHDMNDGKQLDSDQYVPLFQVQGDTSTAFGPGFGPDSRDRAEGWADLDLQNEAGANVEGKFRWEVYADSAKEDLIATSSKFTDGGLRSAVAADRTNKRNMPAEKPAAGNDSWLVLAFRASESSDGDVVSADNSEYDLGIPYSEYK